MRNSLGNQKNGVAFYPGPVLPPRTQGSPSERCKYLPQRKQKSESGAFESGDAKKVFYHEKFSFAIILRIFFIIILLVEQVMK